MQSVSLALMEGKSHQPVLVVAGPTASGKSALALSVAEEFDGVVINAGLHRTPRSDSPSEPGG